MASKQSNKKRNNTIQITSNVVSLIGSAKTRSGLKIKAKLDLNEYPTGNKVSDEDFLKIN
ncbi:MAG: ISAzo13-like element transposase-related protein [Candidatus Scalindua sp.]